MKTGDVARMRIRELRKERKMSQADFAEILGITPVHVSRIETGMRGVTPAMIDKLCDHFGVPRTYFFEEGEPEEKPAPTIDDLRKMALMVEAGGGIDAPMARWIAEVLEKANQGPGKDGLDEKNDDEESEE